MANRIWRFIYRRDKFWEDMGIPYVPSLPIVGCLDPLSIRPQHELDTERCKRYGRIFGQFEGKTPVVMISEPSLLEKVLSKDFPAFSRRRTFRTGNPIFDDMVSVSCGEKWRRVRDIVQPTFQKEKLVQMADIWYNSSLILLENYARSAGKPVDGKKLYGTYTLDVIALAAFGQKIHSHQDPNNEFIRKSKLIFTTGRSWRLSMWLFFPSWAKFFKLNVFSPKGSAFFRDTAMKEIIRREQTNQENNDFLQLLINAEKEHLQRLLTTADGSNIENSQGRGYVSHDELIAQCILFFLAGFDTTSSTLAFVSYMLALNPEVQEKLIADIDATIKEHGGKITYECVSNMKYLHLVFLETMRLLPAASRIERTVCRDYELGNTGIVIPKETVVAIPMVALHNDHAFFPNPELFRPERFLPAEKKTRHPYTYLPFGYGPRNCLGQVFANMQMKYCMVLMLSHFVIRRCAETKIPLKLTSPQNVLQPADVTFLVERRENAPFNLLGEFDP